MGRGIATANYGTNDNAGPPTRPASPPESTDEVLVSQTRYNAAGEAFESIDPAGMINRGEYDQAGRVIRTIQNYQPSDEGCGCFGNDVNITTETRYTDGQVVALIAKNPATGDQVTRYEYGVTLVDSDLASNDLLRAEIYPDSSDGDDQVLYTYNRQGQRTTMTDQNGTTHEYTYDGLGRPTADAVAGLGAGVDSSVRRITTSYDIRGLVEKITSWDAATGGDVVNEVQNTYNDFGQLAEQYQEHSGEVNTGTTPKLGYQYADGANNTIRPTGMTTPSGRTIGYSYGPSAAADKLSRMEGIVYRSQLECSYSYLGLTDVIRTKYAPGVFYDLATGAGANPYNGMDRFGRIIRSLWYRDDLSTLNVDIRYTYDRAGNRTSRRDVVAESLARPFDELYQYDGSHRLAAFHRGELTADPAILENPTIQQRWHLDATGNWSNFSQGVTDAPSKALDQHRVHNTVNEITDISRFVGGAWVTPAYDRNGNTTTVPQPNDPSEPFTTTWDAWNRMISVSDTSGPIQTNAYDGLNRRILQDIGQPRHYYYSANWQCLEEAVGSPISYDRHYLWGLRYIDDLILQTYGSGPSEMAPYCLQDALFNVAALTGENGGVIERYAYTAYGQPLILDPDFLPRNPQESIRGNVYLFTGRRLDPTTGLYYYRMRFYDWGLGRFLGRDPLGYVDGWNLYPYSLNSPSSFVDPYGEQITHFSGCNQAETAALQAADRAVSARLRVVLPQARNYTWANDVQAWANRSRRDIVTHGIQQSTKFNNYIRGLRRVLREIDAKVQGGYKATCAPCAGAFAEVRYFLGFLHFDTIYFDPAYFQQPANQGRGGGLFAPALGQDAILLHELSHLASSTIDASFSWARFPRPAAFDPTFTPSEAPRDAYFIQHLMGRDVDNVTEGLILDALAPI